MSFIPATLLWHQNHCPRQLLPANSYGYCYGSLEEAECPLREQWRRQEQHLGMLLETCFFPVFREMAFFRFNFSAMAAAVSTDWAGTSAVKVDGAGSWLPSHSILQRRQAVAAARGLGARL